MSARAELLADRGEAALGDDFFRSRPFLDAEGATHTLRITTTGAELLAPLIVRPIPGAEAELDAISPYGYPGLLAPTGVRVDPDRVDYTPTGLISVFIRHTLAQPPPLSGAAERNLVLIADPALPRKQRSSDRNQINKNHRNGYRVQILSGPESDAAQRGAFLTAYEQTMRRTGAARRYFFGAAYFERILESEYAWLALTHAPDRAICAASIMVQSDGFLHYYLSGSLDSHLGDSPMKNLLAALVERAAERALPLNLGGGISAGDPLETFKRGFANREQAWHTSALICNRQRYARLSKGSGEEGGFFPAYRRPD